MLKTLVIQQMVPDQVDYQIPQGVLLVVVEIHHQVPLIQWNL